MLSAVSLLWHQRHYYGLNFEDNPSVAIEARLGQHNAISQNQRQCCDGADDRKCAVMPLHVMPHERRSQMDAAASLVNEIDMFFD